MDEQFKCRSIYFAAYLMCKHDLPLVGTFVTDKKVLFLFKNDELISKAMGEFAGTDKTDGSVNLPAYLKIVNKLKDVAKGITR